MKSIIKIYLISTISLYLASVAFSGLVISGGIPGILLAGAVLAVGSLLIKPVINILLLPINLITFGIFRWVSSAITLFLVTLVVPGIKITGFTFIGYASKWLDIPAFSLSGILALIAFSFAISVFASIIHWLVK
jgi:putative membrane protein